MMYRFRLLTIVLTVVMVMILVVTPAFAITNPDSLAFGTGTSPLYQVFENVNETGDMLFIAEGYVYYATTPTDYTADEAFVFQVLDTDDSVLLSTPLNSFGDRPISIYQTAAQVTALGLVSGTSYQLRIRGNPTIGIITENVTATLDVTDYTDQSLATETLNPLRLFCLSMASNIEANDDPTQPYIIQVQGNNYLSITQNDISAIGYNTITSNTGYTAEVVDNTTTYSTSNTTSITTYTYSTASGLSGTDIFTRGIPGIQTWVPSLFAASVAVVQEDNPTPSGAYATGLTVTSAFGTSVANIVSTTAAWLGVGTTMMGFILLGILAIAAAIFAQHRFESGTVTVVAVVLVGLVGAFLGLVPIAIMFIVVIGIALLMAILFFSKGGAL